MTPRREIEEAIRKEIDEFWPGVEVEFADGGKHPKAKLRFNGLNMAVSYSATPSGVRYIHNALRDVRGACRKMEATRSKPDPTADEDEAPYRKPNGGADARPSPVQGERAPVKSSLGDKLVEAGVTAAGPSVEAPVPEPAAEDPEGPAERLAALLRERGFDLTVTPGVSRASVVQTAAAMIVDGIYFGLPEDVYHAVPRLGASGLADLNKSAGDFWARSWLNPDRDEEEEDDKAWKVTGRAYHCARLEPDRFGSTYCRKPCRADYAEQASTGGACWNGRDIEAALVAAGEPKKKASDAGVADQARRLRDTGYEGVIWPLIEADFEAETKGLIPLDAKVWDDIARDMERLRKTPAIADKFTAAGASEVSVFWTDENNIQRKARVDRLEPAEWLDFKTFDNSRGKRLEQALADAVRFNRYYLTAASYREAVEAVRVGGLQVIGIASDVERALVAGLQIRPEGLDCWFIFQQKSGVPNLLARRFRFFDVPDSIENSWDTGASEEAQAAGHAATERRTQLYAKGVAEIDYAKRLFALYAQVYPPGDPWAPLEPEGDITDAGFNPHWLEGRYE